MMPRITARLHFGIYTGYDWLLITAAVILSVLGLVTMNSFTGESSFFVRQLAWILISILVMVGLSRIDARMLYKSSVIMSIYVFSIFSLALVLMFGAVTLGARNRFDLGFFAFQPSDPTQLAIILVLAKYFARRHMEIGHFKHILVSGGYIGIIFFLLFLQPDFGSAAIVFCIWLGMVLIAGISRRHLVAVFLVGAIAGAGLWMFAFKDYQKDRILTFLHPLADIQGTGYNAYQSTIAVGSGGLWGKGIGYGSQSKLEFLPEYETDFIFAAYAEEWGFVGVAMLLLLFSIIFWRLIVHARYASTNFETLTCAGIAIWFLAHLIIHAGMNVGILPVTGTTIPFLSYGGSHLMTEFAAIGLVLAMMRYERSVQRENLDQEIVGFEEV